VQQEKSVHLAIVALFWITYSLLPTSKQAEHSPQAHCAQYNSDITCYSAANNLLSSVGAKCHIIRAVIHYCEDSVSYKFRTHNNEAQKI